MSKKNDRISNELIVDLGENGGFSSLEDALDFASTLTRDASNYVLINIACQFLSVATNITIPTYCIVRGRNDGVDGTPGTLIGFNPAAGQAETVIAQTPCAIENCYLFITHPANYSANSYGISMSGTNKLTLTNCRFIESGYSGANTFTYVRSVVSSQQLVVNKCIMQLSGTSCYGVDFSGTFGAYNSQFLGNPRGMIKLNNPSSSPSRGEMIWGCRLQYAISPSTLTKATDYTIEAGHANTRVFLHNTRLPLDERGASIGTFYEVHPSPQQLKIAKTASNRTVASGDAVGTRTTDAYTDGTIECDSSAGICTVFAPVYANAINGQEFTYKRRGANNVIVDGNGVNIDGVATQTIGFDLDSLTISKNDSGTWSII